MKTMSPPGYRHNGFVGTHALYHMMYGYTLLVPMKQRVLNTLSKEHNRNGHRWSTTFDIYIYIYINSLTHFVFIAVIVIITLFFSFLRYNCSFHYCFIHFIIINAFFKQLSLLCYYVYYIAIINLLSNYLIFNLLLIASGSSCCLSNSKVNWQLQCVSTVSRFFNYSPSINYLA